MILSELIKNIKPLNTVGDVGKVITGVEIDSRKIKAGNLFAAIKGTQADGHRFITKAIELGATAILCEDMPETICEGVAYIQVESTETAIGIVATAFYGFLSTVCNYIEDNAIPTDHTTPDPIELNRLLAAMVDAGCEYAFMECSSHAIAQKRIGGLTFAGGIFTNLTRDHLDYHKTFENYRDAKKAFFDSLPKTAFAIINADDKNGMFMVQNTKATVKTYSTRGMADFKARILESHFEGMYLDVDGREVGVQFIGKFNVSNLLAVYGAARMLGKERDDILVDLFQNQENTPHTVFLTR